MVTIELGSQCIIESYESIQQIRYLVLVSTCRVIAFENSHVG